MDYHNCLLSAAVGRLVEEEIASSERSRHAEEPDGGEVETALEGVQMLTVA